MARLPCPLGILLLSAALTMHPGTTAAQTASPGGPIVGIDHIPVAVNDLDTAEAAYRLFGFSLKPGRPHPDGIRNAHIKFPDGAGIELITAREPTDALARRYVENLKRGEGPTEFALHARDTAKLAAALKAAGYGFEQADGFVTLRDPQLGFVFFVQDNRSPTDRPEHFAHPNSAVAMVGVWLAPDDPSCIDKLLLALGAAVSKQTVPAPMPTEATVYTVENGQITVLPKRCQIQAGRPVVGAVFRVTDLAAARACLSRAGNQPPLMPVSAGPRRSFVSPSSAGGIWLEFREEP